MQRRDLLRALGALPVAYGARVRAQVARMPVIAWLSTDSRAGNTGFEAFRERLIALGHEPGRTVTLEERWGDGVPGNMDALAAALVASRPDIIVTQGPAIRAIRGTQTDLPVVFGFSGDPVAAGYADSLARPGRNMTGVSFMSLDLAGKRIQLLKEVLPALSRVAILANPEHPGEPAELRVSNEAAAAASVAVAYHQVRGLDDLERALANFTAAKNAAINLFPDAGMMRLAGRVAAFSVEHRVPAISGWAIFARRGNLLSYGPNLDAGYGRLATYVDRILKGARPRDLPIELPTKIELVVNQQTARALGIVVPRSVLLRADELIG